MKLTEYIANLLLENDCIIIPNFGGFITNYKPAFIDQVKQKIYPPNKLVVFNKNLTSNDGLLANYIAKQLNIDYNTALIKIEAHIKNWITELNNGGQINIGEVGFLYQSQNTFKFEQNLECNILLSSYGFTAIPYLESKKTISKPDKVKSTSIKTSSPTVKDVQPETSIQTEKVYQLKDIVKEVRKTEKTEVQETKKESKNTLKLLIKYSSVAAIIPLLFYLYWIPMNSNVLENGNLMLSDFNPFHTKSLKTYQTRIKKIQIVEFQSTKTIDELTNNINPSVKVYNYQFDETTYIPVLLDTQENVNYDRSLKTDEPTHQNKTNINSNNSNNIHLIAGCFSEKHNAEVFVEELKSKGYQAHIVDKNKGLYRVAAGSFPNKPSAKTFKNELEKEGYNSWILKK
jgi:hypothetical protein